MDVLIAMGTNAAYFYSVYTVVRAATSPEFTGTDFFETSAMLISFIILGKYLEVMAKGKTSEAIAKLMDLAPDTAILLTLDEQGTVTNEREIASELIQRRDFIKVCLFTIFFSSTTIVHFSFQLRLLLKGFCMRICVDEY